MKVERVTGFADVSGRELTGPTHVLNDNNN